MLALLLVKPSAVVSREERRNDQELVARSQPDGRAAVPKWHHRVHAQRSGKIEKEYEGRRQCLRDRVTTLRRENSSRVVCRDAGSGIALGAVQSRLGRSRIKIG